MELRAVEVKRDGDGEKQNPSQDRETEKTGSDTVSPGKGGREWKR
jgi:hypothetical protein